MGADGDIRRRLVQHSCETLAIKASVDQPSHRPEPVFRIKALRTPYIRPNLIVCDDCSQSKKSYHLFCVSAVDWDSFSIVRIPR